MPKPLMALISLLFPAAVGAFIFGAAGRWDFPMVWGVLGELAVFCVALVLVADRGLIRERAAPGPGNQDRLSRPLAAILLPVHWILTGLDIGRFQRSLIPEALQIVGLVGYALCLAILLWAMRENAFYSSVVRIQSDRGHHPITTGPYRWVRHPGYTATMAGGLFGGMALGSWLGLLPIALFWPLFVRRTLVEDRMLQRDLPGYAEYAQRVRYRLIVGIF